MYINNNKATLDEEEETDKDKAEKNNNSTKLQTKIVQQFYRVSRFVQTSRKTVWLLFFFFAVIFFFFYLFLCALELTID